MLQLCYLFVMRKFLSAGYFSGVIKITVSAAMVVISYHCLSHNSATTSSVVVVHNLFVLLSFRVSLSVP